MIHLRPFSYDRPESEWRRGVYFFQYGPWDLRIHCVCGAEEAFMTGAEMCEWTPEGLVYTPHRPCRDCGTEGPFLFLGLDKAKLDCVRDYLKLPLFGGGEVK